MAFGSIICIPSNPSIKEHHCALCGVLNTADTLSEEIATNLITHDDKEVVGEGRDHKVGWGYSSGTDRKLDLWDINQNKANCCFEEE